MAITLRHKICEVRRRHAVANAGPGDFVVEPTGEIEPEEILRDPRFSLYCYDPANGAAHFVECDDPRLIDDAVFYYSAQAEHATALVSMPLETFHRLAREIPEPGSGLIFVHSVGRCGSTLLSKALAAVPGVLSLSEPDDLTQLVTLRVAGTYSDAELRALIESGTRWHGKPRPGRPFDRLAIKTRAEALVLGDLLGAAFPRERHLFLYRDGIAWMRTLFRGFSEDRTMDDMVANRQMEEAWGRMLPLIGALRNEEKPMNPVAVRMLAWITCMEGYLDLREMSVPVVAARFEDLTANPIPVLKAIFDFCEFPQVDWPTIEAVLARDSQEGTIFGQAERHKKNRVLTEDLVQQVRDLVATRPRLQTPEIILPGTI